MQFTRLLPAVALVLLLGACGEEKQAGTDLPTEANGALDTSSGPSQKPPYRSTAESPRVLGRVVGNFSNPPLPSAMKNGDEYCSECVEVEVFYATDRSKGGSQVPNDFYKNGRGDFEYGVTGVSIPRRHKRGELESPVWWKLEFSEKPDKHVVLRNVQPMTPEDFHDSVAQRTDANGQNSVLVFVHGFNVTFKDAVRRTAQLAYDLKFSGVPVTYSWPSQGELTPLGYTTDETNVEWTEPHLKKFLSELKAGVSRDTSVHIIAHSMGNRALTKVLSSLAVGTNTPLFSQIILAAPDIDREVFERDLAPLIVKTAQQTTLYVSSKDKALMFSMKVHKYARAGQAKQPLVFVKGLDTVDATDIDTDTLGHSYLKETLLITDLFMLTRHGMKPGARLLGPVPPPPGTPLYWLFPK